MRINKLQFSVNQYVCFIACFLLMLIVPICRSGKLFGHDISPKDNAEDASPTEQVMTTDADGVQRVNTTSLTSDVIGYAGPVPVEITIKEGKISKVRILENQETPEYLGAVKNSDLLEAYDGLTPEQALDTKVDAVTGATYTSNSVIKNMQAGVRYALEQDNPGTTATLSVVQPSAEREPLGVKFYVTLAVILCAAVVPLFLRNQKYRLLQLVLNVAVLGFWGGTFISYSLMVSALTNGLWKLTLIPVAVMLLVAFVYPMFGRVNHYCTWICPYGSLQDLAAKCCPKKISVGPRMARGLTIFRDVLWFGLMWLLWTGLWMDWMGYEVFAAFFFGSASPVVLGIAGAFLLLSFVVPRPYCRFVCPTGTLFKLTEGRR